MNLLDWYFSMADFENKINSLEKRITKLEKCVKKFEQSITEEKIEKEHRKTKISNIRRKRYFNRLLFWGLLVSAILFWMAIFSITDKAFEQQNGSNEVETKITIEGKIVDSER